MTVVTVYLADQKFTVTPINPIILKSERLSNANMNANSLAHLFH